MTHVPQQENVGSVPVSSPRRVDQKSVLFCPRCGHDSPVEGDWELTIRPAVVDIHCPECRERLARRPIHWDPPKERSGRDQ